MTSTEPHIAFLGIGLMGFFMAENDFPVGPMILAVILGPIVESNFMRSILKSNGDLTAFVDRPIAMVLAIAAVAVWSMIIVNGVKAGRKAPQAEEATQPQDA